MSIACGVIQAAPPAAKPIVQRSLRIPARSIQNVDLRLLEQMAHSDKFHRNETILNKGDKAAHAYRVVSGLVRICAYTINGRRQILCFRRPGEFFGFMQEADYNITAEAACRTTVARYLKTQLEGLLERSTVVRNYFTALMVHDQKESQDHMVMLGRLTALQRVAQFLLVAPGHAERAVSGVVHLPMSRQDIADYLGLTTETVCRALHELKRQGAIVALDVQHLRLRDPVSLERLAAGAE